MNLNNPRGNPDNLEYIKNQMNVNPLNNHIKFLSPEKQWSWFICKALANPYSYISPVSLNKYWFFRGQKRLIKDIRDLEHFRLRTDLFREIKDNEEIIITKEKVEPTLENPIPSPKIMVDVYLKKKGHKPKKE